MVLAHYLLSGLLALVLLAAGGAKLVGTGRMRQGAERFGMPWPRYRLIGVLEVAAVIGILAGLAWRPPGLAAGVGTAALMVGALAYHRRASDPLREMSGAVVTLAFAVGYLAVGLNVT